MPPASRETTMKICPVAIAVGCPKCPVFKVCPAKASLGGYIEALPKKVESELKAKAK
jgi:hypothetical protein